MTSPQLQHLTTALAGRYRVVREIGRGGMATVYLADDPKHHLAHDPFLESLRGDAEYAALMQRVQRRWQAFDSVRTLVQPLERSGARSR